MKKNNTSLRNKLLSSKFDFVKNLKWFFLASCIVIVAGIFTIIFAGFNLGMDFTGGTVINIQLGESIETDKGYNDALSKINKVMQTNNLKLSSSQKEGEGADLSIVIKYQFASCSGTYTFGTFGYIIVISNTYKTFNIKFFINSFS